MLMQDDDEVKTEKLLYLFHSKYWITSGPGHAGVKRNQLSTPTLKSLNLLHMTF